jgi:ribosomal protein S18 acetylase RimI-like enzyme
VVAIFRAKIGRANNQAKRNITIMNEEEPSKKKSGSLVIRQMEIDDLAQVFHLGEKLFTAREVPNLYRTWDEYEVVNLFQSDPEFCLVAEIDDEIVGFILGTTIEKTQSAWKYGQLVWLGTEPEFQRQGIAVKLFRYFQDLMLEDGVRMLLTDTEADNLPALHFFRKLGFGHPQQHIYLTLNLSDQLKELKGKKENQQSQPRRLRSKDE